LGYALAGEAALAQAGPITTKAARSGTRILEQMRLNSTLLKTSVREAAQRFGLGRLLDDAARAIDDRVARGGDSSLTGGPPGVGGAGGGAVWIASDMGTLVIGPGARINASGAGGARGLGSPAADDGGAGGGSGGLIVLQAPAIMLDPSAQIFANGGGGGGGAEAGKSGHDGSDPTGPSSGSAGGQGGSAAGLGGFGYSALAFSLNGADGDPNVHGGGGGGGGGAGAIRVASSTTLNGTNVSPPPAQLTP
jgi:hypothetical protein